MVEELTGGYKVKHHAKWYDSEPIEIDFTPPFRRIDMIEELEKVANFSIPKDLESDEAKQLFADACIKFDINCPRLSQHHDCWTNLWDTFWRRHVESYFYNQEEGLEAYTQNIKAQLEYCAARSCTRYAHFLPSSTSISSGFHLE